MPIDHLRYDLLTQDALRGVIRSVLTDAATKGLPGEHHFFITFDTRAEGVQISSRMKAKYPQEMTIVLQHQFWDLKVTDDDFEVGLAFNGIPERLHIPLKAVKAFHDPSVQFGLQFTVEAEAGAAEEPAIRPSSPSPKLRSRSQQSRRLPNPNLRPSRNETRPQRTRPKRQRRTNPPQPRSYGSTAFARSSEAGRNPPSHFVGGANRLRSGGRWASATCRSRL
jgi:uncharacterized protein